MHERIEVRSIRIRKETKERTTEGRQNGKNKERREDMAADQRGKEKRNMRVKRKGFERIRSYRDPT